MGLALYRKYRPKTLGELVGQETIAEILKNAAAEDRIGHGYLFYGPRGTGKTTTARLIAKLLNCETRRDDAKFRKLGEPCNRCNTCKEIDEGVSLDLIEIDAASNRGIDEIRNLKENIKVGPASSSHKVYIIDESHMLTQAAVNALLKTLEEPPPYAVLILATTEYDKLPATIVSRLQRFLFKKLPKTKILEKIRRIAKEEKIEIEDGALELIAAAGEGSLRDAESLLDQVRSLGAKITLDAVERLTGRVGLKKVEALAEFLLKEDLPASLEYIAELNEEGQNLVQFTKDLIHYLRKVLSLSLEPALERHFALELTNDEIERMKRLKVLVNPPKLTALLKSLLRAYSEMPYSPLALVSLEVALAEQFKK